MVVDDTEHVRKMLVQLLTLDGFRVVAEAGNGKDAAALVKEFQPDIVVMDYSMPGMTGLDAAREIFKEEPDQHVILYSAYIDPEVEREAASIGVAACVAKVEGLEVLERRISELVVEIS